MNDLPVSKNNCLYYCSECLSIIEEKTLTNINAKIKSILSI